jgi:hypothetical protein
MWGLVIVGVLAVASVAAVLLGGRHPRENDRGGFEQHPGTGGGWPGGPLT